MLRHMFDIFLRTLPVLLLMAYTIGYGIHLRRNAKPGMLGTVLLSLLNAGMLIYLVFYRSG